MSSKLTISKESSSLPEQGFMYALVAGGVAPDLDNPGLLEFVLSYCIKYLSQTT